jgi:hypothetical protein
MGPSISLPGWRAVDTAHLFDLQITLQRRPVTSYECIGEPNPVRAGRPVYHFRTTSRVMVGRMDLLDIGPGGLPLLRDGDLRRPMT